MFYNIMPHESEEDYFAQIEQIYILLINISQCGKSVVWTMAGNIDKLLQVCQARFFSEIRVLALTCGESALRKRMTEGRGITDKGWINGSVKYNEYFRTHEKIGKFLFPHWIWKINPPWKTPTVSFNGWTQKSEQSKMYNLWLSPSAFS